MDHEYEEDGDDEDEEEKAHEGSAELEACCDISGGARVLITGRHLLRKLPGWSESPLVRFTSVSEYTPAIDYNPATTVGDLLLSMLPVPHLLVLFLTHPTYDYLYL